MSTSELYSSVLWKDIARRPVLVTPATQTALSVGELKGYLRIDHNFEDDKIGDLNDAAELKVQDDAEIALLTSTWAVHVDCFPLYAMELRRLPVQSVTSVAYLDSDGASQTVAVSDYVLSIYSKPARITPAYTTFWPLTYPVIDAVTITFVAGQTSRANVLPTAKQAIRMLVAHWYRNSEAVVSTGAQPVETPLGYDTLIESLRWNGGL